MPERKSCVVGELEDTWNTRTGEEAIELELDTDVCQGSDNEVNYIEHVQAFLCKFGYKLLRAFARTKPSLRQNLILSRS